MMHGTYNVKSLGQFIFEAILKMKAINSSETQGLYAAQHDIVSQQVGTFVGASVSAAYIASN